MSSTRRGSRKSATNGIDVSQDDAWICKLCQETHVDKDAKLLECQRCQNHFCIKCLNKPKAEYDMLSKTDCMWFCIECRRVVEQRIAIDLDIEARCKEIMESYEQRISWLEESMRQKCDVKDTKKIIQEEIAAKTCNETKVREIVKEVIADQVDQSSNDTSVKTVANGKPAQENVSHVIEEIRERKTRENNLMIFGMKEHNSDNKEDRESSDREKVNQIFTDAKIKLEENSITSVARLGNFVKNKEGCRPLMVELKSVDIKVSLFKNMHYIKDKPKYQGMNMCNDLTKAERENEKRLWAEAKKLNSSNLSGDFMHKVRGPPWARKIVKVPVIRNTKED